MGEEWRSLKMKLLFWRFAKSQPSTTIIYRTSRREFILQYRWFPWLFQLFVRDLDRPGP